MTNPLETLAGGNFEPTPQEHAKRILDKLQQERLARIAIKGEENAQPRSISI